MKLYNCVTELEKELQNIGLDSLKPADKGMLAIRICDAYNRGELEDTNIVVGALEQIVLSLVPLPTEPVEVIDFKQIFNSYPVRDREIVLAAWGNEYVTCDFYREAKEFSYEHYFHWDTYGSKTKAYLAALGDFRKRIQP